MVPNSFSQVLFIELLASSLPHTSLTHTLCSDDLVCLPQVHCLPFSRLELVYPVSLWPGLATTPVGNQRVKERRPANKPCNIGCFPNLEQFLPTFHMFSDSSPPKSTATWEPPAQKHSRTYLIEFTLHTTVRRLNYT